MEQLDRIERLLENILAAQIVQIELQIRAAKAPSQTSTSGGYMLEATNHLRNQLQKAKDQLQTAQLL